MLNSAGIILAGGKALRLNGIDKAAMKIGGKSCLAWVSACLGQDLGSIAISLSAQNAPNPMDAPESLSRFEVIPDWPSNQPSIIFAILGSLSWARHKGFDAIITSPVDTPFLPQNYVRSLWAGAEHSASTVAVFDGQIHGLHAMWAVSQFEMLKTLVLEQGIFKISDIHQRLSSKPVEFDDVGFDPFFNINTPEALKAAQLIAKNL